MSVSWKNIFFFSFIFSLSPAICIVISHKSIKTNGLLRKSFLVRKVGFLLILQLPMAFILIIHRRGLAWGNVFGRCLWFWGISWKKFSLAYCVSLSLGYCEFDVFHRVCLLIYCLRFFIAGVAFSNDWRIAWIVLSIFNNPVPVSCWPAILWALVELSSG